jgi:calpain-15
VDYEFPANEKSVATYANLEEYRGLKKWLRPKEIYGTNDFNLYHKFIEPNDIQQGNLGDCAFLSAISALAVYPELIKKLFINKNKSECGLYGLNIIWKGVKTEVIVDDLIPVDA